MTGIVNITDLERKQAAEIERLRKDAERYRWLRTQPEWLGWEHDFRSDEIDREVDAAMKGQPS